jgi:hypothetical protein
MALFMLHMRSGQSQSVAKFNTEMLCDVRARWDDAVVAWKKRTPLLPSLRAVALRTTGVASGDGAGLKEYRSALNCPAQAPFRVPGFFLSM